ncbi:MAG TPA: hypothetical protein VF997_12565 [Polyangia bacterium]
MLRAILASALLLFGGCLSTVIPDHAPATTDDATVKLMLARRDFQGAGFVRVDRQPFASDLEADRMVTMYVSADAAAAYEAVTPESDRGGPAFPVGGMVVRTSSDSAGNLKALTFMVKHEPGYFPEVGDFAFGVTDPSGTPVNDDGGAPVWGKVQDCAMCHETRAAAGFLFGVAIAHR